jgi:hypothetical protein
MQYAIVGLLGVLSTVLVENREEKRSVVQGTVFDCVIKLGDLVP